jgi:hypothetical protein
MALASRTALRRPQVRRSAEAPMRRTALWFRIGDELRSSDLRILNRTSAAPLDQLPGRIR